MTSLLAVIAGGVWIFGFIALGRILLGAVQGRQPADPQKSDLWAVVGASFGIGVVMLIILAVLGFFSEGKTDPPKPTGRSAAYAPLPGGGRSPHDRSGDGPTAAPDEATEDHLRGDRLAATTSRVCDRGCVACEG